jgi:hypothetical protein
MEFWNMFWTAYVEMMFISLGDLFFLDYHLLLKKLKKMKDIVREIDPKAYITITDVADVFANN